MEIGNLPKEAFTTQLCYNFDRFSPLTPPPHVNKKSRFWGEGGPGTHEFKIQIFFGNVNGQLLSVMGQLGSVIMKGLIVPKVGNKET